MPHYRYPLSWLLIDGSRAVLGIAVTLGPLAFLELSRPLALFLGALAALFLWFGYRVLVQSFLIITPTTEGLLHKAWRQRLFLWKDLRQLKLAYYAPMRRRNNGWYQLTIRGKQQSLSLDSTLIGFDNVLQAAIDAASDAALTLDVTTRDNIQTWTNRRMTDNKDHHAMVNSA